MRVIWRAVKDEVANSTELVSELVVSGYVYKETSEDHGPPKEVKSLADEQERLLSREERLSCPGDVLVRRIPVGAVGLVVTTCRIAHTQTEPRRRTRNFCGNDFGLE